MSTFDSELAALLALDALDADEQADAELRMGTFPPGYAAASAALAENVAAAPPAELRAATLERALGRRTPGRPVDGVRPCEPAEAFDRTIEDMWGLLNSLTDAEWDAPAHPDHGRVRDLIAHLVGVERLSARWLDPADQVALVVDHIESTRAVVDELADESAHEVARQWYQAVRAVAAAAAQGDPDRPVSFHDLVSDVPGFLITRTFELWAHTMDICAATGRPMLLLDDARMAELSRRLMAVVPLALAYGGSSQPGRTARFVLTGRAGGVYTVPLDPNTTVGEPDVIITTDPTDLCRLAASRLDPAELAAVVEGDEALAHAVLSGLDAFARD
jgi:uncharacterized protein (TIGR03083 family)